MTKECLSCKESINTKANKCQHCGSLQLIFPWVQQIFWVIAFFATATPLIILAVDTFDGIDTESVNIEFLSDNHKTREMNFLVKNTSKTQSVVFDAFYKTKSGYSDLEINPTIIKGNSYKLVTVKLGETADFPEVISSIKAVFKNAVDEKDQSTSIEKFFKWWSEDEPHEWWADEDTCSVHFLVKAGENVVKKVDFKCQK